VTHAADLESQKREETLKDIEISLKDCIGQSVSGQIPSFKDKLVSLLGQLQLPPLQQQ